MKKADLFIIIAALLVFCIGFFMQTNGKVVKIFVNGELYREAKLSKNETITVKSTYGENTVVIKDGTVFVKAADCPDRLCEKRKIKKGGQSIICLPNRLSVVIEGNDGTDVVV